MSAGESRGQHPHRQGDAAESANLSHLTLGAA